jgi:hypothetical protein
MESFQHAIRTNFEELSAEDPHILAILVLQLS